MWCGPVYSHLIELRVGEVVGMVIGHCGDGVWSARTANKINVTVGTVAAVHLTVNLLRALARAEH